MAQVGFIIYLLVGIGFTLVVGPYDVYATASLVFVVVFAGLVWMCWRGKPMAFLASAALSVALIFVIAATFTPNEAPVLVWETALGTIILVIISLEGVVAYAELKGRPQA